MESKYFPLTCKALDEINKGFIPGILRRIERQEKRFERGIKEDNYRLINRSIERIKSNRKNLKDIQG